MKLGRTIPAQILLTNSDVRCFAEAGDGSIWLGLQDGGLFRYDYATRQASQIGNEMLRSSIHALYCADRWHIMDWHAAEMGWPF